MKIRRYRNEQPCHKRRGIRFEEIEIFEVSSSVAMEEIKPVLPLSHIDPEERH
jgi:hypothetical protein